MQATNINCENKTVTTKTKTFKILKTTQNPKIGQTVYNPETNNIETINENHVPTTTYLILKPQ